MDPSGKFVQYIVAAVFWIGVADLALLQSARELPDREEGGETYAQYYTKVGINTGTWVVLQAAGKVIEPAAGKLVAPNYPNVGNPKFASKSWLMGIRRRVEAIGLAVDLALDSFGNPIRTGLLNAIRSTKK